MNDDDSARTPSELAVQLADEWLDSHRKSEAWRIVNMLRDEVVRLASRRSELIEKGQGNG